MATFRTNKTKTTKPALRRMKGYSATLKSKVGDTQTVTYVVTHPDGQETTHVTHHGQARNAFWERFPSLANSDNWEGPKWIEEVGSESLDKE